MNPVLPSLKRLIRLSLDRLHTRYCRWTRPLTPSLLLGTITDLGRSKPELIAENALLRQQLVILKRQVKRPACTKADRLLLVLLARIVRTWKQALFIIQPETLLRAYLVYFNQARPRRGIRQQIPEREATSVPSAQPDGGIISVPVLGGLHHEYRRVA